VWFIVTAVQVLPMDAIFHGGTFALVREVHVIDEEVTFALSSGERMSRLRDSPVEVYRRGNEC
jgi:hypothetical protein